MGLGVASAIAPELPDKYDGLIKKVAAGAGPVMETAETLGIGTVRKREA